MQTVYIRYRPFRIGWCVRVGNVEDMRKALRWTHCFWGGTYNPIIPVDDSATFAGLIDLYQVDALYPVADEPTITRFVERFPHLRWPILHKGLFIDDMDGRGLTNFLDIYHPLRKIHERHIENRPKSSFAASLFAWDDTDPLRDVFAAQFGTYPSHEEIHIDYSKWFRKALNGRRMQLPIDGPVPGDAFRHVTPSSVSAFEIDQDRGPNWDYPGFYVGDATDFADIVHFWNLRAATLDIIFLDPNFSGRLDELKHEFMKALADRPRDRFALRDGIGIWSRPGRAIDATLFQTPITRIEVNDGLWNGLNLTPPGMYMNQLSTLCTSSEYGGVPSLSFELREKPFYDEIDVHTQTFVASVRPLAIRENDELTFIYPYLPELNDFYRREAGTAHDVRSERNGLGIVTDVMTDQLTVRAVSSRRLISKIFEVYGMKAGPSEAGRITSRVIGQMGGIQGGTGFQNCGGPTSNRKI
jgi:hypothetical protein